MEELRMKVSYSCEKCGEEFGNLTECAIHEQNCGVLKKSTCDKCGKVQEWLREDPMHHIDLGRMGYYSRMDGSDINFCTCDDCLYEWLETFKNKEDIFNSGANSYYDGDPYEQL